MHESPDTSSKATLWVKAQHEGALPPPCIVRKDPRSHIQLVPHRVLKGHRHPRAASAKTRGFHTQLDEVTFHFHALEKEMATHSSILAWRISGTGSLVGCRLWGHTESDMTEAT